MKSALFLLLLMAMLLGASRPAAAQEWNTMNPREFVIVLSTKDYNAALGRAREASRRLGYPLDILTYNPHKTAGLSMPKKDCEGNGYDYPCYIPRGNGGPPDNPRYVTIEWSTGYEEFKPGYYIVVVAEGTPGSNDSRGALAAAKKFYKDAYVRRTRVWYGCMH